MAVGVFFAEANCSRDGNPSLFWSLEQDQPTAAVTASDTRESSVEWDIYEQLLIQAAAEEELRLRGEPQYSFDLYYLDPATVEGGTACFVNGAREGRGDVNPY